MNETRQHRQSPVVRPPPEREPGVNSTSEKTTLGVTDEEALVLLHLAGRHGPRLAKCLMRWGSIGLTMLGMALGWGHSTVLRVLHDFTGP